jgi:oligopeptide transport system permease protein
MEPTVSRRDLVNYQARSPWRQAVREFFKNKMAVASAIFILLVGLTALLADNALLVLVPNLLGANLEVQPLLAPRHYDEVSFEENNTDPCREYPLGADYLGRDILSRTLYGARISLAVALVAALVSLCVGVVYGLISGYAGRRLDNLMMRFVDYLYAFPVLMFVILIQVYFKALARRGGVGFVGALIGVNKALGGLLFLFIAIGLLNWLQMARITRGQVLSLKTQDFIQAAQCVGASQSRILFRHLLPNIIGPCIVAETLQIPSYIFTEAFLSFLGLGVEPPTPSWGIMIAESYQALRSHPALLVGPGLALTLTTLAFNFLGDGLRDAFDPRLRGG